MNGISVIIVTFNNEETIKNCLGSIFLNSPGVEVIVVDNNSNDRTVDIIKGFRDKVILLQPGENLGFSKANNLGVDRAKLDFLIFLNPDTEVLQKSGLEKLREALVDNPDFGLLGPKLVYPNNEQQKSVRNLPTIARAFKEYILGIKGSYDFYLPDCESVCEVESVVGACMITRRDIFKKAERFDEKFFLYFEDLDLCRKVRNLGFKVGFYPEVKIKHYEGASGKGQKTNKLLHQSAKRFHGVLEYYLIQIIIRIGNRIHG
ncbi:hypothetical protein A3A14_00875 [Candidatus Daviesbacteria bacterium RIFCSPLOWO2_01_FULL_43_38]|uniref:Glycosyltransferase 2-like domain-containing protein n=3 Tax=Candidatus Daviesiibacteriota TaxID=1752718 RepID=A0A1F5K664_9BACT|nr:MAG: glycosyl transferase family 2 [Candidatus Daviesbacteria bacterium GW2011_GWA1_42_6]KKS71234.1 MAG: glycosyl transferase family 2 [Candidatus Daviesbacteria bacterium GW2011_GWA2_42_7]OGE36473.1 MAG: hypothetical protein A3E45_00955 [Candidatus Daviesbacteria bacterium RIFCSPHIGHO2_12_FULL_43_11]OGE63518.1 MAG: hypothetical protein A3A14_00875 [Candidatus Daviesbacteria bacterium RIFCSPLOWO2_01_FULL_43_38]